MGNYYFYSLSIIRESHHKLISMNIEDLSEDDVRFHVAQWLKTFGISDDQIRLEYSIKLKLGKGTHILARSRADILVRNVEGNNLLMIELKNPSHELKEADQHQALSYARSVADGGIAPFTILTNLKDARVFDSVTGEEIGDKTADRD
jgi:calcineurin-like phosphoesterase